MPRDRSLLQSDMARRGPKALYIAKPPAGSCGKGIFVFSSSTSSPDVEALLLDPSTTTDSSSSSSTSSPEPYVVQHYVPNPLLIDGRKFDLRIYVLVTSYDPLRVYVFDEGIARFAGDKYSTRDVTNVNAHLTNHSVNKQVGGGANNSDHCTSNKWTFGKLRSYFRETLSVDFDEQIMHTRIDDLILKTLLTAEGIVASKVNMLTRHRSTCFELLGFDVLLTSALDPVLMEVNVWPSLNCGAKLDKHIKYTLIAHTMTLVGLEPTNNTNNNSKNNTRVVANQCTPLTNLTLRDVASYRSPKSFLATLSESDRALLRINEEENARRGAYRRLFPVADGEDKYMAIFDTATRCVASLVSCRWEAVKKRFGVTLTSDIVAALTPSEDTDDVDRDSDPAFGFRRRRAGSGVDAALANRQRSDSLVCVARGLRASSQTTRERAKVVIVN
eukprot:PhM_4_TR7466/c0_g1_i1/m.30021/K16602/TTLL5, TTLL10; tubulin polyglutamylase TTLL5